MALENIDPARHNQNQNCKWPCKINNHGEQIHSILLDFSKTFDKSPLEIIMKTGVL